MSASSFIKAFFRLSLFSGSSVFVSIRKAGISISVVSNLSLLRLNFKAPMEVHSAEQNKKLMNAKCIVSEYLMIVFSTKSANRDP